MIYKVFGIYDAKCEAYLPPFFMKSKGEALRALSSHVGDSSHNFSKYASDFTLFELGEFSDSDGSIKTLEKPLLIINLIDLKV